MRTARDDLSAALKSRTVIDTAIGAIMAQNRCSREAAFQILVKTSSHRNIKLKDVAASIVSSISGEREFLPPTTSSLSTENVRLRATSPAEALGFYLKR